LVTFVGCHKAPAVRDPVQVVLETGHALKGTPYRYGGRSPAGFDCSGFVWYCYNRAGLVVPATTDTLRKAGKKVTGRFKPEKWKPGDLLFFKIDKIFGRPNHVGIYAGHDRMLHASTSRGVVLDDLNNPYWKKRFVYARRIAE